MTTQPNIIELTGFFTSAPHPIREGDWWKVGQQGDGLVYFNKIKAISGMSVTFGLLPKGYVPYNYTSVDGITDFWVISGQYTSPTGRIYNVGEFTGDLADREAHPAPFEDNNADMGPLGGPNLIFKVQAAPDPINGYPGEVGFQWSRDPQPAIA